MSSSTTLDDFKASIIARLKGVEEKKAQAEKTRSDYIKLRSNINARIDEVDEEISGLQNQIESGLKAIGDLERIIQDEQKLQKASVTTETVRSEPVVRRLEPVEEDKSEPVVKSTEPTKSTQQSPSSATVELKSKLPAVTEEQNTTKSVETVVEKTVKEERKADEESTEEKPEEDPFMSEDGLPIMEIYEELDDDGNIISSQARPQRSQQLVDFANGPLAEILKKEEQNVTEKKKQLENVKTPKPYGPEKPDWLIKKQPNPYDPPSLQPKPTKKITDLRSTPDKNSAAMPKIASSKEKTNTSFTKPVSSDVERVLTEVKPVVAPKNETLTEEPISVKKTEEALMSAQNDNVTVQPLKSEDEQHNKISPIASEELVELQIIAGDDDSESDFEAGDNWEYNEEDYDDEESEDEFGRTRGSLFPFAIPQTIQKSIEEKRVKGTTSLALKTGIKKDDTEETTITEQESVEKKIETSAVISNGSGKRQVRFAETVNVKTFEKDPREVHGNIHGNVGNLFDIAREQMEQNGEKPLATTFEQQLENLLYPDGVPPDEDSEYEKVSKPVVTPTEDEQADTKKAPKMSRFKAARLNMKHQQQEQQLQSDNKMSRKPIKVSPVNTTIVERDFVSVNDDIIPPQSTKPSFPAAIAESSPSNIPAYSQASKSTTSNKLSSSDKVLESKPKEDKKSNSTTDNVLNTSKTTSTSRKSVFKQLASNKNKNRFPTSSRIVEVKSEEVSTVSNAVGDASKFTIPLNATGINDASTNTNRSSASDSLSFKSYDRHGADTIKPGLAQGMGSLLSAEILAKAEDYYQQSLMSEEDFIRAHSFEDDEDDDNVDGDGNSNEKDGTYQNRPIIEDNLIEREFAPAVDSRGMGYVPAKYLHSDGDENESDEEDFTVSRAEIAKEYQKIRQSLIYQTGGYGKSIEELELEPVDEDGNAKKVSRFKAARLSTRRTPKF